MRLLAKAQQVHRQHHRRHKLDEKELLELALAYFNGEIAPMQAMTVMSSGNSMYTTLAVTLRNAVIDKKIKILSL